MLLFSFNPYTWDSTKERVGSDVVTLKLKNNYSEPIKVSNLPRNIDIVTPLKLQKNSLEKSRYFTKNDEVRFHEINVKYENTTLILNMKPEDPTAHLFVYMRFGQRPTSQDHDLNATISQDKKCVWMLSAHGKSQGQTNCSFYPYAPIQVLAEHPGKYFIGVRNAKATMNLSYKRQRRSCFGERRGKRSYVEVKDPPPTPLQSKNVPVIPVYDSNTDQNYILKVALGSCVYWSEKIEKWISSGCRVSVKLNMNLSKSSLLYYCTAFNIFQILRSFLSPGFVIIFIHKDYFNIQAKL